jgi:hypothetical protein
VCVQTHRTAKSKRYQPVFIRLHGKPGSRHSAFAHFGATGHKICGRHSVLKSRKREARQELICIHPPFFFEWTECNAKNFKLNPPRPRLTAGKN